MGYSRYLPWRIVGKNKGEACGVLSVWHILFSRWPLILDTIWKLINEMAWQFFSLQDRTSQPLVHDTPLHTTEYMGDLHPQYVTNLNPP